MPPLSPVLRTDEFPDGAASWPADLDRRDFLRVMGASLALAGLGGCARPRKALVPYVNQPESIVPGRPAFYATAAPVEGYARGVIVETHEGRPTKIEGNPGHSESLGATGAITQASILDLYDPDRSRSPRLHKEPSSWTAFEEEWLGRRSQLEARGGRGLALLTEPTTSPTLLREIHRLLDRYPGARWHQHTPLARYDEGGLQPDFVPAEADVIFSIEGDFLHAHPAALRYARAFARRRRVQGGMSANRLYALEGGWSITGSMADHRLASDPTRLRTILNAVAKEVMEEESGESLSEAERRFVLALAADLRSRSPRVLCIAGPEQSADIRGWALAMNQSLGAVGRTVRLLVPCRSDGDSRGAGDLASLAQAMERREVDTLAIIGSNPAYTASADIDFAHGLGAVPFTVHLGTHSDETAALCRWHLPESHYLETWSDLRGFDGSAVIQQPLTEPLHSTRSAAELVRLLGDPIGASDYELVRETWRDHAKGDDFDSRWELWLNQGFVDGVLAEPASAGSASKVVPRLDPGGGHPSALIVFRGDPMLADGRYANNGWLQELPRPFTTLTWDNAALISPAFAAAHQLANGDLVILDCNGRSLSAPVWIVPGHADNCVLVHLGGGRAAAGGVGNNRGFNAYRLRTSGSFWEAPVRVVKAGHSVALASTQHHFDMEGRDLARIVDLRELPAEKPQKEKAGSLYPEWPRDRYAWGMSIDLSTCLGCSACVVACQAENNIPVVGKEQVLRGREMHWIRVDRYTTGGEGPVRAVAQPVPCMHCENAPCELVCPVSATVHSSEGLNEMVYNRCVGTRYCSNNCPYKVRRFNFFDFRAAADSPLHLQDNPDVTVRSRGVMEKCTYCVQRINAARSAAEREGRRIRDGDVRTACQQACPVEAIVFGDISDPQSAVSRKKRQAGDYAMLAELNTRPRTTYLPKVFNPAAP